MKLTDQARAWLTRLSAASQDGYTRMRKTLPVIQHTVAQEFSLLPRTRATFAATSSALLLCGAISAGSMMVNSTPKWNQVYTNGSLVGVVPDDSELLSNMQRIATGYHIALALVPVHQVVSPTYNWRVVASLPTRAAAIRLNGTSLVYTTGVRAATRVLHAVKQALTPSGMSGQSEFDGRVTVSSDEVPVTRIVSEQTAVRLLLGSGTNTEPSGRSTSFLPTKQHHPSADTRATTATHTHRANGSDVTNATVEVPNAATPRLHVLSSASMTRVIQVAPPVRYVDDSQLSTSVQKVLTQGAPGKSRERVRLHFVDRQLTREQVLSRQTITAPQPEVIERGTNPGVASGSWDWPTDTTLITSPFGWRYLGGYHEFHPGVDIGCSMGSPIYATNNGYVEDAGWNSGGYGIWVRINNGDGIETVFGHMSKVTVTAGQEVAKGQLIGYSGDTGEATGPHLHYEVRKWGTPIPPEPYM